MHMIRHTSHTVAFTTGVSSHRREVSVKLRPRVGIKEGVAVLGAKDDMNDYELRD